ncbi:glycoside hydrolase family 71/99-like protein [Haloferula sp. A504]|uniref:glycoside hydrolase family 71/99-like protein n=1 Tax=Haloferula sp. A504 TaxID=3373601 RepID=UPI0031C024A2|nr:glycoside hydrolase family 71/99-like protein [Verrucomicrobiaceae bacterium E54]
MKTLLLVILALAGPAWVRATTTTVWNPAAAGIFPPTRGSWSDPANWTGGVVPDGDFKAVLNVAGAAECVLDTAVTVTHLVTGDNGPGGTLRLAAGAELTCTDWAGPYNRSSEIIIEAGATADFQSRLLIGQFADPGDHEMVFRMTGGEVNVGTFVRIGESFGDATNVVPHIQINGGVLTADRLEIGRGTTDITAGMFLLRTDQSGEIADFIDAGKLTAYGGTGTILYDWDNRHSGRLTITALPPDAPGPENPLLPVPTPFPSGGEGYFTSGSVGGKTVWTAANMLYFDVPNGTFPPGFPVYLRIEYLDEGRGRLEVKYDSDEGADLADKFRPSEVHTRSDRVNGGGFVDSYHELSNPLFANRQNGGNDFRIEFATDDGTPFSVASVALSIEPFPDPDFAFSISRPWLGAYAGPTHDFVDPTTTRGKVMTGYQGWFAAPNDPDDLGWRHWSRGRSSVPSPETITVDMWPWLEHHDPAELYRSGDMQLADGRPAYVFSSRDPGTVQRHFRWMWQHDIDGAYLQRFVSRGSSGAYGAPEFVLHNVRRAANLEGRVWAIEYDVSSMSDDPDPFEVITRDWNWLVEQARILEDPRYLHHDGKPVLFIWGFSVPGREGLDLGEANAIIDWFKAQGLHLIAGVHSGWLGQTGWHGHYQKYDALLGWMENDAGDLAAQKAQLDAWNMDILPHAWPGFSWHNLKKLVPFDEYTPRNGGAFYWQTLHQAVAVGADQIFLGMFDEYDEGTAIMPMSDNPPQPHGAWGHYLTNEGDDPFRYLRLSAAAREMLNGFRPVTSQVPATADTPEPARGGQDASVWLGDPDQEEGLTHPQPGDGVTVPAVAGGLSCRTLSAGSYLYFGIDDAVLHQAAAGAEVTIEVEVFDDQPDLQLRLQYDGLEGAYIVHPEVHVMPGSGGWRNLRWVVPDGYFGNRQNSNADFRIARVAPGPLSVRRASVFLPSEGGLSRTAPASGLRWNENGELVWSARDDATGWRLFESGSLEQGSWSEVGSLIFQDEAVRHAPTGADERRFFRLQREPGP